MLCDLEYDTSYLLCNLVWDALCLLYDMTLEDTSHVEEFMELAIHVEFTRIAATWQKNVVNAWAEEMVQGCKWIHRMIPKLTIRYARGIRHDKLWKIMKSCFTIMPTLIIVYKTDW